MVDRDDPVVAWRRQVWWRRLRTWVLVGLPVGVVWGLYLQWPQPPPQRIRVTTPGPEETRRARPDSSAEDRAVVSVKAADLGDTGDIETVYLDDFIEEINAQRSRGVRCPQGWFEAAPLSEDRDLTAASSSHAIWMTETGEYSHISDGNPAGDRPSDRASYFGFDGLVAENIAWGQTSAGAAVRWWADSPTHCPVLMNPDARWVGVAAEPDPLTSGWVWVMLTGA